MRLVSKNECLASERGTSVSDFKCERQKRIFCVSNLTHFPSMMIILQAALCVGPVVHSIMTLMAWPCLAERENLNDKIG